MTAGSCSPCRAYRDLGVRVRRDIRVYVVLDTDYAVGHAMLLDHQTKCGVLHRLIVGVRAVQVQNSEGSEPDQPP